MTAAELLNDRYEVIADYPNAKVKVGDILIKYFFEPPIEGRYIYVTNPESPLQGRSIIAEFAEKMPHLFRKMNWWEKRTADQMPKKVMSILDDKKNTFEIEEWDMEILVGWVNKKERTCCSLLTFKPEFGYIPID